MNERVETNRLTYRKLKPVISQSYPKGRFVAIDEGQVVADASSVPEMYELLLAQGRNPKEVVVVEAGIEYPASMTLLSPFSRISS